jgi:DMSO/TMAO reductase YedYZ heme-binding membrane subunit
MKRFSKRWWRDVHIAGYWVFWGTCIHAALAGTDTSKTLYTVTSLVAVAMVVFAASYRVLTHDMPKRGPRRGTARPAAQGPVAPSTAEENALS